MEPKAEGKGSMWDARAVKDWNPELEKVALSAMMLDAEACFRGLTLLTVDHFVSVRHQLIFRAVRDCYDRGESESIVLVLQRLREMDGMDARGEGALADAGGETYVCETREVAPAPRAMIEPYARRLTALLRLRQMKDAQYAIKNQLEEGDTARAAELMLKASQIPRGDAPERSSAQVADAVMDEVTGKTPTMGWATGVDRLTKALHGLRRRKFYAVAARTGEGKSALALQVFLSAVLDGARGLYLALEMDAEECVSRLLQGLSGISLSPELVEFYDDAMMDRIRAARAQFASLPIRIDENTKRLPDIIRKCEDLRGEIDIIVVDNLQNVIVPGVRDQVPAMCEVTRTCKAVLAKENGCAVIGLSQFNQEGHAANVVPGLQHLKFGTSIPQDADAVIIATREDYHDVAGGDAAMLRIVKGRGVKKQDIPVTWRGSLTRFVEREG